jgi:antitoxin ParD1/3/4
MKDIELSLPDDLQQFVEAQAAARGLASPADYVLELVRGQREIAELKSKLQEGIDSGPGEVVDATFFDRLRAELEEEVAHTS